MEPNRERFQLSIEMINQLAGEVRQLRDQGAKLREDINKHVQGSQSKNYALEPTESPQEKSKKNNNTTTTNNDGTTDSVEGSTSKGENSDYSAQNKPLSSVADNGKPSVMKNIRNIIAPSINKQKETPPEEQEPPNLDQWLEKHDQLQQQIRDQVKAMVNEFNGKLQEWRVHADNRLNQVSSGIESKGEDSSSKDSDQQLDSLNHQRQTAINFLRKEVSQFLQEMGSIPGVNLDSFHFVQSLRGELIEEHRRRDSKKQPDPNQRKPLLGFNLWGKKNDRSTEPSPNPSQSDGHWWERLFNRRGKERGRERARS